MKAATTNATVVKKPNEFWTRVRELYMAGELSNAIEAFPWYYKKRKKEVGMVFKDGRCVVASWC